VRLEVRPNILTRGCQEANLPILSEVLFAAELVLLHAAPVYYGLRTPHGDGSGVVLIPGFLCPDHYLFPLHRWLGRQFDNQEVQQKTNKRGALRQQMLNRTHPTRPASKEPGEKKTPSRPLYP